MSGSNRTNSQGRDAPEGRRVGPNHRAGKQRDQPRPERAQTTLDFAIGVSIFLSAMIFTFAFAPGILSPFTESGQQNTVTVDRVADHLSQDMLGSPAEPYVLNRTCTVAFFDGSSPPQCRWDSGSLNDKLGLGQFVDANVTIIGNVSGGPDRRLLHWDQNAHEFTEVAADGEVRLATGETPPTSTDEAVTAQRVASLHRDDVTIRVVVW